ncbi:MAG: N-acetylneuraminate synthase family protein, partial [Candidatus Bilamarchaeaceae archaeon]
MNQFNIGNIFIGENYPPFIIAEAGINHNGDLEIAIEMIKSAKRAGAHAIKFQTFKAEEFIADPNLMYTYKSQGKTVTEPMIEMFKRYEFSREQWFKIKEKCDEVGIIFLSTPQNISDLELLLEIGVPAIKVGSDDLTNLALLEKYSKTNLPLIISCGMATISEVCEALETIGTFDGYPTILLICTSEYPTPPEDANLLRISTAKNLFPDLIVGFSDHTRGCIASCVA